MGITLEAARLLMKIPLIVGHDAELRCGLDCTWKNDIFYTIDNGITVVDLDTFIKAFMKHMKKYHPNHFGSLWTT